MPLAHIPGSVVYLPLLLGVVRNALDNLIRECVVYLLRVLAVIMLVGFSAKDTS